MTILDAMLLGLVQGLTEFLPVSSSGHLVLTEHLLGLTAQQDLSFEIFVHFGTVVSILAVYHADVRRLLASVARTVMHPLGVRRQYGEDASFRMTAHIVLSSIPAGVIGLAYEDEIAAAFTDPKLVATMLIVTGLILFLTRLFRTSEHRPFNALIAVMVGCAQAVAIIPGISRSGSTISMAMYWKVSPAEAARFSFLMSVPVILGATLMKTVELIGPGTTAESPLVLLVGTLTAFVSGYGAIRLLLRILSFGKIRIFALYCLIAGSAGILFL